ncbi:PREDICTED: alpha-2-macroglobulin-like [Papilio xuthus]|uniref:Alpha-2-macroglobulin-like n=1 Tax=Papilio xuthus TaxID=66420 RepID=A0AAJ7E4K8_PAPXU|nr:PREDICTED: alpha-2-macroglobulin-like [Papilio xuthus]
MLWFLCLFLPASAHVFGNTQNITRNVPCTDKNHLFLAPGVLSAGGVNRACISRFHPEGPARMVITLLADNGESTTAARDLPPGDGGCLDISVPLRPNTKADLIVNMRYPEAGCTWERRLTVRVAGARVLVIQVQRARLRPGDTLRVRAFALKPDLTPAHGNIDEMWVEGPRGAWEGVRVAQWRQLRTRLGLAQLQHRLDDHAPPGIWTVRARLADGSQGSTSFWVGNYELPPFQLTVKHSPRVLRTSERLVWTVCVRYPWTEAVEGMLVIRLRGAGGVGGGEGNAGVRTAVRLRAPRACHRHAAAARRVGLTGPNSPDVIVADFSFQEEGTRIWQNTTVVSQVVDNPVTLEFLTKHRAVVSPSLPYKLKVKATRWDDKPASGESVRVCRRPAPRTPGPSPAVTNSAPRDTCVSAHTDGRGIARVMFTPDADESAFYDFEARLQNASAALRLSVRAAASLAALGPLRADSRAARTLVPLYLNLSPLTKPLTVHFVVITRGGIIYRWGATTQCAAARSGTQIQPAARNSSCSSPDRVLPLDAGLNNLDADSNQLEMNASDALLDRHLLRVMLPVKVTHQMCPDSHLLAYFYHNGELVSASKHFEMDECFANKVEARWSSRQVSPGAAATLQLSTPGPALCALSALDSAALWLQPQPPLKDTLLQALKKLVEAHRNLTEYDAAGECFLVEARWSSRQVSPGAAATLQLSTPGPALCALSALDSAALWLQPQPPLKDTLLQALKKLVEAHRNLTEYDAAGECFLTSDAAELPSSGLELTRSWLAAAGVRALGEAPPPRRCGSAPAPAPLMQHDDMQPRTDFSEAWLWRLVAVGLNGSATSTARAPDSITLYEAGAVCLAKTGIAISSPAVLQVFREFFIHADAPKTLRRGDNTIIRYRLFNYLFEPLSVQIQVLADPHLEGANRIETACVSARGSAARRVEVRARVPGAARLRIRAQATSDNKCGSTNRNNVSDEIIIEIQVEPEGVPVQEHKSTMLCAPGSSEPMGSNVTWSWEQSAAVVGTENLTVWAVSDGIGPLLADADALVSLPRGCGEQNMARLATNLLALRVLDPRAPAALAAREHVARGFTRQLQYSHAGGGFSAFGPADPAPSTWLTAFSLRYMHSAYHVLSPGLPAPPALRLAERWLLSQQMENGCFRNEGQVFHTELKGGLDEDGEIASVALTAYVITSLIEGAADVPLRVIRNSLSCLRAFPLSKSKTHTGVYAHSLLAYALMRLRKYEEDLRRTNEAYLREKEVASGLMEDEELRELVLLLKLAKRNKEYVYWETGSLATSIEASGYGLLALRRCGAALRATCAADARAVLRWLASHTGPTGGFLSTQDTLVAMEAIIAWSSHTQPANLSVSVSSESARSSISVVPGNRLPALLNMGTGHHLTISVEGSGCGVVQATRTYNTLSSKQGASSLRPLRALRALVAVRTDGIFHCRDNNTSCFCAAIIEVCALWGGGFPQMALLEVWLPGGYAADARRLYQHLQPQHLLLRRIELSNSGGKVTLYLGAREGGGTLPHHHHHCFTLHLVGPRTLTRPAHVKLTNYYQPTVNDVQMYTIPEDCPSRVSHETDTYQHTDNLFASARSLDTGEIIINNDFTFEDLPEGTPLDDPMFENLTEKKDTRIKKENPSNIKNIITDKNITKPKQNVKDNSIDYSTLLNIFQSQINYINGEINEIIKHKYQINNKTIIDKLNPTTTVKNNITVRPKIDNPKLSSFHVIESDKDLEVPTGVEGPVPAVVLPPKDFIFNSTGPGTSETFWRAIQSPADINKNVRDKRKLNHA